jgi:hypothetical protein
MVKSPPADTKALHRVAKQRNILRLNLNVLPRALTFPKEKFHTSTINKTPPKAAEPLELFHILNNEDVRRLLF